MIDVNSLTALTIGQILSMCFFAFATSASPGPVNIVLVISGARFGVARSFPYVFGATVGFIGVLLIVGSGLGAALENHPFVKNGLSLGGAAYMGLIAYRIARADIGEELEGDISSVPGFVAGVIAQISNPKAWIVSISAVSIYVGDSKNFAITLVIFCTIFFVICGLSLLGWSAMGAYARKRISNMRVFNLMMAILLLVSIGAMLVEIVAGSLSII